YQSVWKEDKYLSDNTIMVHIRNIREKIEDNPREPRYIKTVWGVGYKVE
ncbi:helix-turn-helix domain-containing protein, partial [Bacillus sp. SIMBA_069]